MSESGIHIKPSHEGLFTGKANRLGMTVSEYARKVRAQGSKADAETKKQAVFAENAKKWNH